MNNSQSRVTQSLKLFFGMFMVMVYLGMAWLMIDNFFGWANTPLWNSVRWFFALIFGAYGIYRGYRELKGQHTYGMRTYDDDQEEEFTTYSKNPVNKDSKTDINND